jgi:drug/metabolite transporter (DMT)-like permease
MKNTTKAHLSLFFVNALYGANNIIAKDVMPNYLTPNAFIAIRVFGASLLFWLVYSFNKIEKIAFKDLIRLAFCGIFGVALNQLTFFHGLNLSSAINSGIIMTFNPIIVAVMAYFILKEQLGFIKIIGIVIGLTSAILLTILSGTNKDSSLLGDSLLFINTLSYAIYLIIVKPLMKKYSALTVTTYVFTFGLIYVFIYPETIKELSLINFSNIPANIWFRIIYVIIGVTFFTYLLTMYAMKFVTTSVTSTYIYIQPIMVILFAYLFLYFGISKDYTKDITILKLFLMLIIFTGVYLVIRSDEIKNKLNKKIN